MKAIIFGASGQDGFYLRKLLLSLNIQVIGVARRNQDICGDISDFVFVEELLRKHLPDYIFHFAANSTTRHTALFDNHLAISTGTINILENVRKYCPDAKVFLSGSAMQFKNEGLPINEMTDFDASSAYSVARIHSVYAGRYYRDAFNMKVYSGYFFNHDSPFRLEQHVNQKIVMAVLRIAAGSKEVLELGDINVKKEFNFAGDVVEAVWMLVNQDDVFEAVIGSGVTHSIKDWLEYCFKTIGADWEEYVVIQENYKSEYDILVSDPSRIMKIGWRPRVGFKELADIMLENK